MTTHHLSLVIAVAGGLALTQQGETWLETAIRLYWNGEYEQTIAVLSSVSTDDASAGERIERHKYLAFSYIALEDNDGARREFTQLLSVDPGYELNPSLVSPKVIEQFELARKTLIESLFDEAKTSYHKEDYDATVRRLYMILRLDPEYELAHEYLQLSAERAALTEQAEPGEASESQTSTQESSEEQDIEPEDRIYQLSSEISPPILTEQIDPEYPKIDSQLRIRGRVVVLIIIGKDGTIETARILSSVNRRIDRAVLDAVNQWKYEPARLRGKPVRVMDVIVIAFEPR